MTDIEMMITDVMLEIKVNKECTIAKFELFKKPFNFQEVVIIEARVITTDVAIDLEVEVTSNYS